MKRTLLTASAAFALMAVPAIAQTSNDDLTVQGDTQLQTELTTDMNKSGDMTPADDWDTKTDIETDTELKTDGDVEAGIGGEYYESEEDAQRDADLGSQVDVTPPRGKADVDVTTPAYGAPDVDVETPNGADVDVDVDTSAKAKDGMGGPEAIDRNDAAEKYGNLDADASMNANTDGLSEYEKDQIEKAGEEAVEDVDTVTEDDLSY